jgi:hypothetical protein
VYETPDTQGLFAEVDQQAQAVPALMQIEQTLLDVFRQDDAPGLTSNNSSSASFQTTKSTRRLMTTTPS